MAEAIQAILSEVEKAVVGKREPAKLLLSAILAEGHVLIDDVPGVGKTTLAIAISRALGLEFRRIQFTPDVLPSDITGFSVYDRDGRQLRFVPGVVMEANLLLGDEINRTSSKTQSALLEAMEERQVTVDGRTYALKEPFVVIATQNNVGSVGTQLLPYAQLDRFLLRMQIGYPDFESQVEILRERKLSNPLEDIHPVISDSEALAMRREAREVAIQDAVLAYITRLAAATRAHPLLELGVSPRGALWVSRMARAWAYVQGRDYATPQDVRDIFPATCAHRLLVNREGRAQFASPEGLIAQILAETPAPDSEA